MSFTIEIDASEVDAWAARFDGASDILADELKTAMVRVVATMQRDIQVAAPVWHGNARRSVQTTATATKGTVYTNLLYAIVQLETGREAGKPMPPEGALLAWMAEHGIPPEGERGLRRKIGRDGIPARRLFTKAFEENKDDIEREFQAVATRVVARLKG